MDRMPATRSAVVLAALALAAAPLAGQAPPDPGDPAYLDETARALVQRARERRETLDRSITSYTVTMKEQIGMGIRALRRDRMVYHRELALRITWNRDTVGHVEVIGAREGVPIALKGQRLPEDLVREAPDYAFDPSANRLALGSDSGFIVHPLAVGSEEHYRFETGDSTTLAFPDGRRLRIYELRVIPRRLDSHLVAGSLWIEGDGYGVVRLLTRLARPFDLELDIQPRSRGRDSVTTVTARPHGTDTTSRTDTTDAQRRRQADPDVDDIPGFLKPIRAEVRFFAVEYSLWDDRWWLPRLVSFDAVATVSTWAQLPLRYELLYEDYRVTGDTGAVPVARDTREPEDSARTRCEERYGEAASCRCRDGRCFAFTVDVPPDTAALLASAALPAGFRSTADTMMSEQEIVDLAQQIRDLPGVPGGTLVHPPRWGLARFNRIEALSLGARGDMEAGPVRLDGLVRIGAADLVPNAEIGVAREGITTRARVAGYYRLAAADTTNRPFGVVNSGNALFFGIDDGDYFRALGVELTGRPSATAPQVYAWRLYAERQRPVAKETDVSLRWVFDRGREFRPNIVADSADQFGATLAARATRTFGAGATTLGADVLMDGAFGTFDFVRASLTLRATFPLPGPLVGGLEVAGGSSGGTLPVQSRWYLGGPFSLRGYGGGTAAGEEFWRARAEVANDFPAARLALFADAGRAARRGALTTSGALLGVGAGVSFFDGIIRIDVARATRAPTGWRADFYFDGVI
jgi:hypothetical protein